MDEGEALLVDEEIGISQDISCPAGNMDKVTIGRTDSSGEVSFSGLPAGKYCIAYMGGKSMTTKLTVQVYLSSEQVTQVFFGISDF